MRKKDDTLRDMLLGLSREIADAEGIEAVNIRSIAGKAGIATGTVYNYFSNKDEILLALTEEYWKQTLAEMEMAVTADSFWGQVQEMFFFLKVRIDRSAGKLMNSLGNVEAAGLERMASIQAELETALAYRMEQDLQIRKDVWNETFTRERFARFTMMNLMMLLKTKAPDIDFFIALIRRTIY